MIQHPILSGPEPVSSLASLDAPSGVAIGDLRTPGLAFLAPMAGVTDVGMRRIACRFGASLAVSEMVSAASLSSGQREMRHRAEGAGLDIPVVQIAGCDAEQMAEAGRLAEGCGAAIIDINMGCPAKRVTGGYSGSALMRDLDHAARLIEATVSAVGVPVTVKMRLGWDHTTLNAPALARRAEQLGVRLVTVHGRTRAQFYAGSADWQAVRAVKQAVTIPVVVNGDCRSFADARRMLAASGADAVMLGRAALGQPWLVGQVAAFLRTGLAPQPPAAVARRDAAREHYETILAMFGVEKGLRHARKHLSAYADHAAPGSSHAAALRTRLVTTTDPREVPGLLDALFDLPAASDQASEAA